MVLFDFEQDGKERQQPVHDNPFVSQPDPSDHSRLTNQKKPVRSAVHSGFGGSKSTPMPWQTSIPFGNDSRPSSTHGSSAPVMPQPSSGSPRYIKRATEAEIREAWPEAISRYQLQTVQGDPTSPQIDNSLVPRVTQEQHKAFNVIKHLPIHGRRIYGKPGSGLGESKFGEEQIRSGTAGEQIFAKLLSRDGVLDRCISFWSMARPTETGERDSSGADVDCALLINNHLLLIDVKNYRAGLAYHTLIPDKAMFCVYPAARVVAQQPYIFSVNMNWARNNLYDYLNTRCPGLTIETFVVLVPGESGEATLDPDITWPGGIPAYSYSSFLGIVNRMLPPNQGFVRRTPLEGFLASMVKHYTCSPIEPDGPVDESAWPKPTFDADRDVDQLNEGGSHGSHGKSGKSGSRDGSRAGSRRSTKGESSSSGSSRSSAPSGTGSSTADETPRKSHSGSVPSSTSGPAGSSSGSAASTGNHPFGDSRASTLPKGWGSDDVDDDDDWVPPSRMPKPRPSATASKTSTAAGAAGNTRESAHAGASDRRDRTTTPTRRDPFARPDEQPSRASSASARNETAGSSRRTAARTRSASVEARSASKPSNQQYSLDHAPQVNASSLSYTCGLDPSMQPVSLSLSGVSGMVAAGTSGMGEITSMLFMSVLIARRAGVFMRFIDCKDNAYLDEYRPAFVTLVHRSQGLDAILKEAQAVKGLVDTRSFLVKRLQKEGDYWKLDSTRRLKPLMLFVHECGELFNLTSNNAISAEDRNTIDSIKSLLQEIIERGRQAGVIVVLSTQQPSQQSLPTSLVNACQMRLCFGAVEPTVAAAIFGDRISINDNPTTKLERSHAMIFTPEKIIPDVRFYTIAKSVTEGLLNEAAQA